MADATLAIHLIDDGGGSSPPSSGNSTAPQYSAPPASAPRPGPPSAPAAGPSYFSSSPLQSRSVSSASNDAATSVSDLGSAVKTFAINLAGQAGLGGLFQHVRTIATVTSNFVNLVKTAANVGVNTGGMSPSSVVTTGGVGRVAATAATTVASGAPAAAPVTKPAPASSGGTVAPAVTQAATKAATQVLGPLAQQIVKWNLGSSTAVPPPTAPSPMSAATAAGNAPTGRTQQFVFDPNRAENLGVRYDPLLFGKDAAKTAQTAATRTLGPIRRDASDYAKDAAEASGPFAAPKHFRTTHSSSEEESLLRDISKNRGSVTKTGVEAAGSKTLGPAAKYSASAATPEAFTAAAPEIVNAEAVGSATGPLAAFGAALGPVTIAVAALATVAVAAGAAIKGMEHLFRGQTEKLSNISPEVANASAETEIRQFMSTMRRGEKIGPQVAQWERVGSQVDTKMADAGTAILNLLSKWQLPMKALEGVGNIAERVGNGIDKMSAAVDAFEEWKKGGAAQGAIGTAVQSLGYLNLIYGLLKTLAAFAEDSTNVEQDDPFLAAFLNGARGNEQLANMPNPAAAARQRPVPPMIRDAVPQVAWGGARPSGIPVLDISANNGM